MAGAALLAAVTAFPLFAGNYPVKLLQEILIWGIFAMSLDLLMGYAGMVSFGHSAFFGVGGYVAALLLAKSPGLFTGLVVPAAAAALAALVIGLFSTRVSGVYFIMLTLAFSQMFYAITFQAAWLGAEDGIVGVPRPAPPRARPRPADALSPLPRGRSSPSPPSRCARVVRSPVRPRAARASTTTRAAWRRWATRSRATSSSRSSSRGRSPAWRARCTRSSSDRSRPDAFLWTTSGEALLMVIIGGTGTLGGAVLGAAAFILLQSLVSSYTERWMLILGLTFILFVLFAPGGIVGALRGRVGLRA